MNVMFVVLPPLASVSWVACINELHIVLILVIRTCFSIYREIYQLEIKSDLDIYDIIFCKQELMLRLQQEQHRASMDRQRIVNLTTQNQELQNDLLNTKGKVSGELH